MSQQEQQQLTAAITAWESTPKTGSNAVDPFDSKYAQLNPPYRSPHALMASVTELRLISGMTSAAYTKILPYIIALPASTTFNAQHAPPLLQKAAGQQSSAQPSQQPGQYFLLRADVFLQDQHLVLYTLLQRNNDPQKFQVMQLWQSFGTM
jgi:type II secretory pathway component PulK